LRGHGLNNAAQYAAPLRPTRLSFQRRRSQRGGGNGSCNTAASYSTSMSPHLYIVAMTKLLDEAVEAVRRLPSDDQDDIARAIMQLAGSDLPVPVVLSSDEREAIARSKAAADRGEFATEEQVRAVWAKHGL
jgi:hypothetical protein